MPIDVIDMSSVEGDKSSDAASKHHSAGTKIERHSATLKVFLVRHVVKWMSIVGLYVELPTRGSGSVIADTSISTVTSCRKAPLPKLLWCVVAQMLHFLAAVRFYPHLHFSNVSKVGYVEIILIFLFTTLFLGNIIEVLHSRKFGALINVMQHYFEDHGQSAKVRSYLKVCRKFCILSATFTTAIMAGFLFYVHGYSQTLHWILTPFDLVEGSWRAFGAVLVCPLLALPVLSTQINSSIFTMYSWVLLAEFSDFNSKMKRILTEAGTLLAEELERKRQHLEQLCDLLDKVNTVFATYLAQTYVHAYPVILLLTYALSKDSLTIEDLVCVAVFGGGMFSEAAFLTLVATRVNFKAHESRVYLLKTKLDNLSEKTIQIMNLFVARLSGPSIGFSVYGLFTIDMPAILTLLGTLIAYVVVVLQFQPTSPPCDCSPSTVSPSSLLPLNWTMTTP